MMNLIEFCNLVKEHLSDFYGKEVTVILHEVNKNNGIKLNGLIISTETSNISPTIYLESFYTEYLRGKSMPQIITEIRMMHEEFQKKSPINMDFFEDFEKVQTQICSKLVHYEKNKELLETIPHVPFLDLAVVFYFSMENELIGKGTVMISKHHMDLWGVTTEELYKIAGENNKKLYPDELVSMADLIRGFCEDTFREQLDDILQNDDEEAKQEAIDEFVSETGMMGEHSTMLVLSNRIKQYGAITMIYPKVLEQIANERNCNLFILPSSVHEVILMPDMGQAKHVLKSIVEDVNSSQVAADEYLSDTIYYYNRKQDEITMVC